MKATPLLLLLLVPFLLVAAACGGGDDDGDANVEPVRATSTPADSPSIKDTPAATSADAQPTATRADGATGPVNDEPVAFQTPDGVTIHGHLYSVAGPKQRVVILAHEYGASQTNWTPFAKELALRGIAALTFDFRGYGESEGDRETEKNDLELETAVLLLRSQDYPLIYIIGASMGGTATLKVAARQDLAGVVTLSSPASIRGLDGGVDVPQITEPKLFIAAANDDPYVDFVDVFMEAASEPKQSLIVDGSEHGTALLDGPAADQVKEAILDFLE